MSKRIALFHATRAAIAPVEIAFKELWPEADHFSLLDEGLAKEVDREGALTPEISERFIGLASYAAETGVDALLFTCTAFGPPMETCRQRFPFPVLTPDEALLEAGIRSGTNIGLLGSHPIALPAMQEKLSQAARLAGKDISITPEVVADAWADLQAGQLDAHNEKIIAASHRLADCDVVLLAQFSITPLKSAIQKNVSGQVLSSPHAAVEKLRSLVGG